MPWESVGLADANRFLGALNDLRSCLQESVDGDLRRLEALGTSPDDAALRRLKGLSRRLNAIQVTNVFQQLLDAMLVDRPQLEANQALAFLGFNARHPTPEERATALGLPVTTVDGEALPTVVVDKLVRVFEAAAAKDYDAVAALTTDHQFFQFTFGLPRGGPAAFWRAEAARGGDPLGGLVRILKQRPGRSSNSDSSGRAVISYTWPAVFVTQRCEVGQAGCYLGPRTSIRSDGAWLNYILGGD